MMNEEILIAALLRHPDAILTIDLEPDHFASQRMGNVFAVMRSLAADGKPVDIFTVGGQFGGGCIAELGRLQRDLPGTRDSIAHYVGTISAEYKRRSVLGVVKPILAMDGDADTLMAEAMKGFAQLMSSRSVGSLDSRQIVDVALDHLVEIETARENGGRIGIDTGLGALDRILGGMHKSDLIVCGARPGMGKTALGLSILLNACRAGHHVGFVSTEMSAVQIGNRLISQVSGIPAHKLRDGSLSHGDYAALRHAAGEIKSRRMEILDMPSCRVSDIALQVMAWRAKGPVDLLIVDYLTRLRPDRKAENRSIEVGSIASDLKTLARQNDMPVIVLAQLSREVERRTDKRPVMADLRDSGVIEQEADQVMFLYRDCVYNPEADETEAEMIIDKNRHGPVMTIKVRFIPDTMIWCDF